MTNPTESLDALAEGLRGLDGPSREMDRIIDRQFFPPDLSRVDPDGAGPPPGFGTGWLNDALDPTPLYTESIDAALALVERKLPGRSRWLIHEALVLTNDEFGNLPWLTALPLAILLALVSALQQAPSP